MLKKTLEEQLERLDHLEGEILKGWLTKDFKKVLTTTQPLESTPLRGEGRWHKEVRHGPTTQPPNPTKSPPKCGLGGCCKDCWYDGPSGKYFDFCSRTHAKIATSKWDIKITDM